ncbi:TIGR04222 domain-containing membrane protein [Nonomuraea sp. NPDC049714]|uniref:TIGR04222 domain-containing membrane protein n=1 Tax=Nonomuraea sp. NPDC049714 TaxID=3364357 RepID=UPI0037A40D49
MDNVLLIAAIGVVGLVLAADRAAQRAADKARGRAGAGSFGHDLSPYELAYLSGGPRRALNAALAVLATAGAVRVSRGARVTIVYGARPSPVPIEQAVLDVLGARPGGCTAGELRHALAEHPALAELAGGLTRRGLLLPEGAVADAANGRLRWLMAAVAAGFVFEVTAIVLAVAGVAGKEGKFLGALLFGAFGVFVGLSSIYKERRKQRDRVSKEGRQVLLSALRRHPRGFRDPGSLSLAVGVPVALYGLGEVDDRIIGEELSAGSPGGDIAGSCGTYADPSSGFGSSGSGDGGGGGFGGGDFGGGGGSSGCGGGGGSGG